jgi:two-component system CheB/CheR fusion protein
MYNDVEELIGFFSLQNDSSQQKEYESHIEKLNLMLTRRNKNLAEVNNTLEEFAYVASNDLKEPVRNVKGMLELIKKKAGNQLDEKTTE